VKRFGQGDAFSDPEEKERNRPLELRVMPKSNKVGELDRGGAQLADAGLGCSP